MLSGAAISPYRPCLTPTGKAAEGTKVGAGLSRRAGFQRPITSRGPLVVAILFRRKIDRAIGLFLLAYQFLLISFLFGLDGNQDGLRIGYERRLTSIGYEGALA